MHSAFEVLIPTDELSTCDIKVGSKLAREIQDTSLIVIDEASMLHRHAFEAIDKSFREVMRVVNSGLSDIPFGGRIVLLGGDFGKMLPVVRKGSRPTIVNICTNRSTLWQHFTFYRLSQNMRVGPAQEKWGKCYFKSVSDLSDSFLFLLAFVVLHSLTR